MKMPTTDRGKFSLPGVLQVRRVQGVPTAFPGDLMDVPGADDHENLLKVVYDKRPVKGLVFESFDLVRERVQREWTAAPRYHDPVSHALKVKASGFLVRQGRKPVV